MAIDLQRMVDAAAQAALDNSGPDGHEQGSRRDRKRSGRRGKRRRSGTRAFVIGAGAVTAGRLVLAARKRGLLEGLQERLVEYEERHFGSDQEENMDEDDSG